MKVLIDDNTKKQAVELDSLLSDYTEALNVDTPENDNSHIEKHDEITLGLSNDSEEDKSDPRLYYQSGKKKGQRRPNADRNKITVSKKPNTDNEKSTIGGEIISGVLFLTLIDLLFPLLITFINNQFSKQKMDANKLRLTPTQKKEIAPICEDVAKKLQLTADPVVLLITSLLGIYGMNFFQLKMQDNVG